MHSLAAYTVYILKEFNFSRTFEFVEVKFRKCSFLSLGFMIDA